MFTSEIEDAYTIFQENIIDKLKDRKFFIPCIAYNYASLASMWGCTAVLSERRLGEAYDFWIEDQKRTLKEGIADGSQSLDHFKHASFISFWLRRMLPINNTNVNDRAKYSREQDIQKLQKFFLRYGNELCALLIGLRICLFYEASLVRSDGKVLSIREDRIGYLRGCKIPDETTEDFVMILKHKNMSPHALYLLFKSLFTMIKP